MIDLHCHILPALDDGPRDLADSLAMAAQAEADGIEAVCATPHIRHDHDVRIHELADRVAALNRVLEAEALTVRVLTGGEVAETAADGLGDADLQAVSLGGGGGWILLEPRPGPLSDSLIEVVDQLAGRGYRALIAHPERHPSAALVERLIELVGHGALIQGTAAMLVENGAPLSYLAEHRLLHVLGSDSHSSLAGRPLRLSPAVERLRGLPQLESHVQWIVDRAPEAIVRGEPLSAPFRPGAVPPAR